MVVVYSMTLLNLDGLDLTVPGTGSLLFGSWQLLSRILASTCRRGKTCFIVDLKKNSFQIWPYAMYTDVN
jgi:hypothetical protein